jgi:hypothetical protein
VQGQVIAALWWAALEPACIPYIFTATTIELGCCIYDFAETASGRYPRLAPTQSAPFFKILEWATPSGSYTHFGTVLWLAYPACILARILSLELAGADAVVSFLLTSTQVLLFVPALMYVWNEAAQGVFIVSHWAEPLLRSGDNTTPLAPVYDDGAVAVVGRLAEGDAALLAAGARGASAGAAGWAAAAAGSERFVVAAAAAVRTPRPTAAAAGGVARLSMAASEELGALARRLVAAHYPNLDTVLVEYGFECTPSGAAAAAAAPWVSDADGSKLLVPVDAAAAAGTEYVVLPYLPKARGDVLARATAAPGDVAVARLVEELGYVSVRRLDALPRTVSRLDFGAIHRAAPVQAAAAAGGGVGTMFYVYVVRGAAAAAAAAATPATGAADPKGKKRA